VTVRTSTCRGWLCRKEKCCVNASRACMARLGACCHRGACACATVLHVWPLLFLETAYCSRGYAFCVPLATSFVGFCMFLSSIVCLWGCRAHMTVPCSCIRCAEAAGTAITATDLLARRDWVDRADCICQACCWGATPGTPIVVEGLRDRQHCWMGFAALARVRFVTATYYDCCCSDAVTHKHMKLVCVHLMTGDTG
jgi:hypothetical protein